MLEGVVTAAKRLSDRPAPRRAIVCIGIGTAEGTSLNPKIVGDAVRKSGATLWVVSVQGSRDASLTNRDAVWTRATEDTGGLRQNAVQATRLDTPLQTVANSLLSQYFLKMVRTRDGAVKGLKGQTAGGSAVLFTRWMRSRSARIEAGSKRLLNRRRKEFRSKKISWSLNLPVSCE